MVDADSSVLPDPPFDRAGRDGSRTPLQWDRSALGGFTTGRPWLPVIDPQACNVADQSADPGSLLSLYRRLIAARREAPALGRGSHRSIFGVAPEVLAWVRELDGERILVLLNAGDQPRPCKVVGLGNDGDVLVGTDPSRGGRVGLEGLTLAPLEGLALRL